MADRRNDLRFFAPLRMTAVTCDPLVMLSEAKHL
jgi:hypothetical protein